MNWLNKRKKDVDRDIKIIWLQIFEIVYSLMDDL